MRPRGYQQGIGAVLGVVVLDVPFCPEPIKIGWSGLEVIMSWSRLPSWSLPLPLEPCSTLLPPPLDFSLHRLKTCSSAPSSLDCSLVDRQRVHPLVLPAHASNQKLLLLPRKSNHLVWGSGSSSFLVSKPCCPAGGLRVCNGHLLCSSLRSQDSQ
jgi:hypothetical protein